MSLDDELMYLRITRRYNKDFSHIPKNTMEQCKTGLLEHCPELTEHDLTFLLFYDCREPSARAVKWLDSLEAEK